MVETSQSLWNQAVNAGTYSREGDSRYRATILEQYKLYVEMADRVSQRRGLTNTFFLSLNTVIFTLIGLFWQDRMEAPDWALVFPLVVALGQCYAWYSLVRSYGQLNSVKFDVVGELEKGLPALPYSEAEWVALSKDQPSGGYRPQTQLEIVIPILFAATYIAGYGAILAL